MSYGQPIESHAVGREILAQRGTGVPKARRFCADWGG